MRLIKFIFLCLVIFSTSTTYSYQWPFIPFDSQHSISSTMGEYRSGHLHNAVDIPKPAGTNVYAVNSGTVIARKTGGYAENYVVVSDYAGDIQTYLHINPSVSKGSSVIAGVTVLGKIRDIAGDHLHFINNHGRQNPLRNGGLFPFSDSARTIVYGFDFFQDSSNKTLSQKNSNGAIKLLGKVDIRSRVKDQQSLGSSNTAPYNISYRVTKLNGTKVKEVKNIEFKSVKDKSLGWIYDKSRSSQSLYYYWVTNKMDGNGYFDTTTLPDGEYYLTVYADDIDGGAYDIANSRGAETKKIVIENGGSSLEADTYEPDDSYTQATIIQIGSTSQTHNIHSQDDVDWYKFTLNQNNVDIRAVANYQNGVPYVVLYDVNRNQITSGTSGFLAQSRNSGTYYIKVEAEHGGGIDSYSLTLTVEGSSVTKPATPTGLTATDNRTDEIRLNWDPTSVSGITYDIYRSTRSSKSSMHLVKSKWSGTSWNDSSVVAGTTYYYRLKACKESVCSDDFSVYATGKRKTSIVEVAKIIPNSHLGVTFITHGLLGNTDEWVSDMTDAIVSKIGENNIDVYNVTLDKNKGLIPQCNIPSLLDNPITKINITHEKGNGSLQNIIFKIDWSNIAGFEYCGIAFLVEAREAQVAKATMLAINKNFSPSKVNKIYSKPIHIIGHSRGGEVASILSKFLGINGIWVDQLTLLDPHPMDVGSIDIVSHPPSIYENVLYSDTYFQNDTLFFDGVKLAPIVGYAEKNASDVTDLTSVVRNFINLPTTPHSRVHSYYFGTMTDDSYKLLNYKPKVKDEWYLSNKYQKNIQGYNKSLVGMISSGNYNTRIYKTGFNPELWELLTGKSYSNIKERKSIEYDSSREHFPNIYPVEVKSPIFHQNKKYTFKFLYQDLDGATDVLNVKVFLDSDRIPNNDIKEIQIAGKIINPSSRKASVGNVEWTPSRNVLGDYYVRFEITDSSNFKRLYYLLKPIQIISNPENQKPDTPTVIRPVFNTLNVSLTPIFKFSEFNDDDGDRHSHTWFDIRRSDDGIYLYDNGWENGITTANVPYGFLEYNTKYKIRVRYQDDKGSMSDVGFSYFTTRPAPKPKVETLAVTEFNQNEAGIRALINSYKVINTRVNFKWGTSTSMSQSTPIETLSGNQEVYTQLLEGLNCGTTYYFQPVVTNNKGTVSGEIKSFETKACSPQIKLESSEGIMDYGKVGTGNCKSKTLVITKQNDMGVATGTLGMDAAVTDNHFVVKGSNNFSLNNKGEKASFEIEFCPGEIKTYQAIMVVNSDASFKANKDRVYLTGEGANVISSGKPDLIIQSPSVSNVNPEKGQSMTLTVNVKNVGSAASDSTRTRFYLSTDSSITTSDQPISDQTTVGLSANESDEESTRFNAPDKVGTYWVGACVDAVSGESNTANNCSDGVRIEVATTQASEHDLSIASFSINKSQLKLDDPYVIDITYGYQGSSTSTLKPKATLYVSKDKVVDSSDTVFFEVFGGIELSANKRSDTKQYHTKSYVDVPAGDYYLIFKINEPKKYSETNWDNNTRYVPVTIIKDSPEKQADLKITGVGFSSGPKMNIGEQITARGIIKNIGKEDSLKTKLRFYFSKDQRIESSDTELAVEDVAILTAGEEKEYTSKISIPTLPFGDYWYGICVDTFNNEADATNNCLSDGDKITITEVQKKPDLLIENVVIDKTEYKQDDYMKLAFTVKNNGDGNYDQPIKVSCYAGTDSDRYKTKICDETFDPLISESWSRLEKNFVSLRNVPPGENLRVTVAVEKDSSESNQNNNETSSAIFKVTSNKTFTLDIDGDGQVNPLTDGLLNLRYQFGFRGDTLIDGTVASNATRKTADQIETYLVEGGLALDIDGDGEIKPLTDGMLTLRYLFDFRGDALTDGAVDTNATRKTPQSVEARLQGLLQ